MNVQFRFYFCWCHFTLYVLVQEAALTHYISDLYAAAAVQLDHGLMHAVISGHTVCIGFVLRGQHEEGQRDSLSEEKKVLSTCD